MFFGISLLDYSYCTPSFLRRYLTFGKQAIKPWRKWTCVKELIGGGGSSLRSLQGRLVRPHPRRKGFQLVSNIPELIPVLPFQGHNRDSKGLFGSWTCTVFLDHRTRRGPLTEQVRGVIISVCGLNFALFTVAHIQCFTILPCMTILVDSSFSDGWLNHYELPLRSAPHTSCKMP